MDWKEFTQRLARELMHLPANAFLVVQAPGGFPYAQAMRYPTGLSAEVVSNEFLPELMHLEPQQERLMAELDWQRPGEHGHVNWWQQVTLPPDTEELSPEQSMNCGRLGASMAAALHRVFGVEAPADLEYRANRNGPEGGPLALPFLGIPSVEPVPHSGLNGPTDERPSPMDPQTLLSPPAPAWAAPAPEEPHRPPIPEQYETGHLTAVTPPGDDRALIPPAPGLSASPGPLAMSGDPGPPTDDWTPLADSRARSRGTRMETSSFAAPPPAGAQPAPPSTAAQPAPLVPPQPPAQPPAAQRSVLGPPEPVAQAPERSRLFYAPTHARGVLVTEQPPITDPQDVARLVRYLRRGTGVLNRGATVDEVEPERGEVVPAVFLTDGVWVWSAAQRYYLERYGIPPHPAFYEHIVAQGYQVPDVPDELLLEAGEVATGALAPAPLPMSHEPYPWLTNAGTAESRPAQEPVVVLETPLSPPTDQLVYSAKHGVPEPEPEPTHDPEPESAHAPPLKDEPEAAYELDAAFALELERAVAAERTAEPERAAELEATDGPEYESEAGYAPLPDFAPPLARGPEPEHAPEAADRTDPDNPAPEVPYGPLPDYAPGYTYDPEPADAPEAAYSLNQEYAPEPAYEQPAPAYEPEPLARPSWFATEPAPPAPAPVPAPAPAPEVVFEAAELVDFERRLEEARGRGDHRQYFGLLLNHDLYLPSSGDPADRQYATADFNDGTYVLAYTSPTLMAQSLNIPGGRHRRVATRELIATWPKPEWRLAINAGMSTAAFVDAAAIEGLAAPARVAQGPAAIAPPPVPPVTAANPVPPPPPAVAPPTPPAGMPVLGPPAMGTPTPPAGIPAVPMATAAPPAPMPPAPMVAPHEQYRPLAPEPALGGMQPVMQKIVPPEHVVHYLQHAYDRVCGYVYRMADLHGLNTPAQLIEALGLIYDGSPFSPDDEVIHVLRWTAAKPELFKRPTLHYADAAIPEFRIDSQRLPHAAELHRLDWSGRQTLVAVFDADRRSWKRWADA